MKVQWELHNLCTDHVMIWSEHKDLIGAQVNETAKLKPQAGSNTVEKPRIYVWSG